MSDLEQTNEAMAVGGDDLSPDDRGEREQEGGDGVSGQDNESTVQVEPNRDDTVVQETTRDDTVVEETVLDESTLDVQDSSPAESGSAPAADSADAVNTIPLYTTAPPLQSPAAVGATHEGSGQDDVGAQGTGNGNGMSTGTGSSQPYVYVPATAAQPQPLLEKTGPSKATIVLGALMLCLGVIALLLGLRFPSMVMFTQFQADPRVYVAVICGVVGVILVVVAVAWALATLIHRLRRGDSAE